MGYGSVSGIFESIWRICVLLMIGMVIVLLCAYLQGYSISKWTLLEDDADATNSLPDVNYELTGKRAPQIN